jgi:hypothetical protein
MTGRRGDGPGSQQWVSAGYFLSPPERVEDVAGGWGVAPAPLGHGPTFPDACFLEGSEGRPGERAEERRSVLARFSIPGERLEDVRRAIVGDFDREWDADGACLRPAYARSLARRFLADAPAASVLGLAVTPETARRLAARYRSGAAFAYVPRWVREPGPPEAGAVVLGFAPVPILREVPQRGCSWTCEGLDWDHVEREAGVRPDERGLLATLGDAERACRWLRTQEGLCGGDDWFAWRVAIHPGRAQPA